MTPFIIKGRRVDGEILLWLMDFVKGIVSLSVVVLVGGPRNS
jgi:hypothetical protein